MLSVLCVVLTNAISLPWEEKIVSHMPSLHVGTESLVKCTISQGNVITDYWEALIHNVTSPMCLW